MAIKTLDDCLKIVKSYIPRTLKKKSEYKVLLKVLAYSLMKNYESMDRLDNAYNVDFVDIQDLPRLADTLGISYPAGADADILRLLLKYYGVILKNRGTLDSIKQMVRLLEYSENDLYNMTLADYTDVEIKQIVDGFLLIQFDGVTDFDYAYRMLKKVVPSGFRFEVANLNGPTMKDFDFFSLDEDSMVNINVISADTIITSESASIEGV